VHLSFGHLQKTKRDGAEKNNGTLREACLIKIAAKLGFAAIFIRYTHQMTF
jgi:hypothetical protein